MADLNTVVKILFSGDDQVSGMMRGIGGQLSSLDDVAQTVAAPFADLAGMIEKVDAGLVGLAAVIGTLSVNEAVKYQSALLDLQKQMDDNEGSAASQSARLEEIAQKYGENANDLVKSTADFKAAGYDLDTSVSLVTQSLNLMIAGGVKTSDAVDIMNRSLAGFQIPAADVVKEAQHIGDVLNKAADITKSSFSELATGFADLAPVAKQTGFSFEETAALLTEVIDVFGSGSEAANGLKSGFLSLVDPTAEAKKELAALRVEIIDSNGQMKSVKDILGQLAPAFDGLTESQKLSAASILFGKEQAGKMVQVLGTYNDAMQRATTLNEQAGGSIEKEVTTRLQSAEVQVKRTEEAIRQLGVHLGLELLDGTEKAAGGVTDLANAFKTLVDSGALGPFTDLIVQQANLIGETLSAMAKNLPEAFAQVDFSGLLSSIHGFGDELSTLFKALFGNIDLTTVEGLASALQTIINIGDSLVLTTQGIVRAFEPFAAAIGATVRNFNDLDSASKIDFGNFIGDMQAIVSAGSVVGGTLIAIGQAGISLQPIMDAVFGGIKVAVNALQVSFDAVVLGILQIKKSLLEAGLSVAEFSDKFAFTDAAKKQNADAISAFKSNLDDLSITMDAVASNLERNKTELEAGWAQATGEATGKTAELQQQLDSAKSSFDAHRAAILQNNSAMQDWSTGIQQGASKAQAISGVLQDWSDGLKQVAAQSKYDPLAGLLDRVKIDGYGADLKGVIATHNEMVVSYTQVGGAAVKATGAFKAVGDSASEQTKKVDETIKKSQEYQLKMEEIASNERIKVIEARVQLNVAELEAQTKQIEATFKSLDSTVSSTGDLLGSLFSDFAKSSGVTQAEIASQIDLENQRRQKALDLQTKLTEAEIDKISAQTAALQRGNAMIQIDGSGLAPQLEAFMWEVLKSIRVRANAEFQSYLLGIT